MCMKKMPSQKQTVILAVIIVATVDFTILWLQLPTYPSAAMLPLSFPVKPHPLQPPSRLLPHKHWEHRQFYPENYNQISCSNFPKLEDIHYVAASWQHLKITNGSVFVFGAYWDDRFEEPLVRVMVYCDVVPLPKLFCQFWYENENAPITVPSSVTYGWLTEWIGPIDGVNEPYILTCRARRHPPFKQRPPAAVSVVGEGQLCGTPTNVLNVQGAPLSGTSRSSFNTSTISVCLKWLQFQDDVSAELVEWIEMIKAFGADKLFVFDVQSHLNTSKVLDYYVASGFADVTKFEHAPQLRSNFPSWEQDAHDFRRELLPLNDCLYRSMHKYQWMTPIDSDEIIVPRSHDTWQQIIAYNTKGLKKLDVMAFSNYYFLDVAQRDLAAPPYMKILGHLWSARMPNPKGYNVKSFHNTSSVVAMHNHYPISCGTSHDCSVCEVNTTIARLHHYRERCGDDSNNCPAMYDILKDDTITKWKHVIYKVDRVLTTLGIKPNI